MTTFQKIVKAVAIALAIFIIFTIVSTILSITFTIFGGNLLFNLIVLVLKLLSSASDPVFILLASS